MKPFLSKSRLISAWQCAKKAHLEKHHPEWGEVTAQTEALWATGHDVGRVAQQLYGTADAVEVEFNRRMQLMLDKTKALLAGGARVPIFEATFQHERVLVRVDVLLPDGDGWRAVEVKASTSIKDYHVLDCAIQDWVMRGAGLDVASIALAHIDNQFVYPGNGDYAGLLVEHDITDQVKALEPSVIELVAHARDAISGPMPDVRVGAQCSNPYDCQFVNYCWPGDAEYPIAGLGGSKEKLGTYVALGWRDIRDVDIEQIDAPTQMRIHRITSSGEAEILSPAKQALDALDYPRYYLDFETIAPAVPFWAGTRPYAVIPVQWSCDIETSGEGEASERFGHAEFLDLSGEPPMRALAEALIDCLGATGPVLMYTNYEERVLKGLVELFPDLEAPLAAIIARLVDLHPIVRDNYYHPDMLGSWSIKAVLPTMAPQMDYADLSGIAEGTAASAGFIEAIDPATSPARRAELEDELLRYCRFDTRAMVEIVRFLTAQP